MVVAPGVANPAVAGQEAWVVLTRAALPVGLRGSGACLSTITRDTLAREEANAVRADTAVETRVVPCVDRSCSGSCSYCKLTA